MSILTRARIAFLLPALILPTIPKQTRAQNHVMATPSDAQWRPATMLPAGIEVAVLAGDPSKPQPFALRLKFPPHTAVPAHWHPADEHIVVTSGEITFGTGDKLDKTAAGNKTLATGGFALMPARMHHFAYTGDEETTVVMYAEGPLEIHYINPADDPRLKH